MIVVEGLRVRFGRTIALDGVDLRLEEGITGLFGPNGSGKSTLLRAVAGLLRPSQGRITFDGEPVTAARENWRRLVGYAGHESGLYPHLSVRENLELFGRLYGGDPRRISALLSELGLESRDRTPAGELSAGFKRRAAVARALVGEPRLLLLDEPYANLDDDSAALVSGTLSGWRAPGRSALIATHGAKKLKAFADAGVILRRGRIVTQGLYRDPGRGRRPFHEPRGSMTEANFVTKTLWLAAKDLRIEMRARDTLAPMLGFAATVALVLAFALPDAPSGRDDVVAYVQAGFMWVTVLFAGLIGFGRTFEVERAEGALDSLLLIPVDRSALFVSKALSNLAFLIVLELALLPLSALLFAFDLGASWGGLLAVVALVDVGFVALGTLYAALAAQTRSRELLLPLLALPALVPVFIAALELTADLLLGAGFEAVAARGWFGILVAFDVVFLTAGALLFDSVLD